MATEWLDQTYTVLAASYDARIAQLKKTNNRGKVLPLYSQVLRGSSNYFGSFGVDPDLPNTRLTQASGGFRSNTTMTSMTRNPTPTRISSICFPYGMTSSVASATVASVALLLIMDPPRKKAAMARNNNNAPALELSQKAVQLRTRCGATPVVK